MTPQIPGLPLRIVAQAADKPIEEVWRLFRLESAPAPVAHVASVPVFEPRAALMHVLGSEKAADEAISRLEAKLQRSKAAGQPPAA